MRRVPLLLALLALEACVALPQDQDDDAMASEAEEIVASAKDDPRFKVTVERKWLMRGDGLTPSDRELVVKIQAPPEVHRVRAQIDTGRTVSKRRDPDGTFTLRLALDAVATGEHTLLLAANYGNRSFATRPFHVTAPLYVVVSTDWDDTRFGDDKLRRMERLSARHPRMVLTHFFAPFHYTDPLVPAARKAEIESWLKRDRDERRSEIGVHIHTWCHFVEAAGVKCRTHPTFSPFHQDTGYVTILASYDEADMRALLEKSVDVFAEHGLGRPTSFRAGGWTADLSTLRALEAVGFTVDSSALPFKRIEEWRGMTLYSWNEKNWQGITETSQPYYPAKDKLTSGGPKDASLGLLEVPDNGILVDYVTGREMIEIYEQNAPSGRALAKPTVFQVGYHPPNFSEDYFSRLDQALSHVDGRLYENDAGPSVYVRISELTKSWRR